MQRRARVVVGVAVAASLLAGCSFGSSRGPVRLVEAVLVDSDTITFGVPSCNGTPEVTRLEETSTQVRIEVVATVHRDGDACADSIEVSLAAPLADRELVDITAGGALTVTAP